jgi:hypothetical protein
MSALHIVFASLGACLEFGGFGLVILESNRLRREELGYIGRLKKAWENMREIVRETIDNPAPQVLEIGTAEEVSTAESIGVQMGSPDPADELRRRVNELEDRLGGSLKGIDKLRREMDTAGEEFDNRLTEVQEQRRDNIANATKRDIRNACIFLLGLAFALVASLT